MNKARTFNNAKALRMSDGPTITKRLDALDIRVLLARYEAAPHIRLCLSRHVFLGDLGNCRKCFGVADREIGQHLAIDCDARELQSLHEPTVGQAIDAGCGIDSDNPKLPKSSLSILAIAVCIRQRVHKRLVRPLVEAIVRPVMAFDLGQHSLVPAMGGNATFDASHISVILDPGPTI